MAIQLTCPHCSKRLAIKQPIPGTTVHCPVCTGLVSVPAAMGEGNASDESKPTWWTDHPDKPATELEVSGRSWHEFLNWRTIGVAAGGSLALLFGLVATAAWVSRPVPPLAVEPEAPVQLVLADLESRAAVQRAVEEPALEAVLAPVAAEMPVPQEPERKPIVEAKPAKPEKVHIVRRDRASDEELRRQLLKAPELTLDPPGMYKTSSQILATAGRPTVGQSHFTPTLLSTRTDLRGMPFRMGAECQLGKEPAENMQEMSRKMRTLLAKGVPNVDLFNTNAAEQKAEGNKWYESWQQFGKREAIPCLMQMLQPEKRAIRQIALKQLDAIEHRSAGEALAKVALYDIADDMRAEAIQALAKRPADEYRQVLLEAFRHPWPPVADHAAEALIALNDHSATSALKVIADLPDPTAPYYDSAQKTWLQPEMVRLNHLTNCLMCHAPSKSTTDLVRGRVPDPSKPLPPLTQYYEDTNGIFVRADVTYLKQDFSLFQPVERPGQWPQMQRYDYIVRARRVDTYQELAALQQKKQAKDYPQRDAALFAIRALSR